MYIYQYTMLKHKLHLTKTKINLLHYKMFDYHLLYICYVFNRITISIVSYDTISAV